MITKIRHLEILLLTKAKYLEILLPLISTTATVNDLCSPFLVRDSEKEVKRSPQEHRGRTEDFKPDEILVLRGEPDKNSHC